MKISMTLLFVVLSNLALAQNCLQTTYGSPAYIPINDLGTGLWNGFMGGLYPNGSNTIPLLHKAAGMQLAGQIQPLDANGNPDAVNGKIGFISIGMSNATLAFSTFIPMGNADVLKNPKVQLADCAEGGMSAAKISLTNAPYYHHYWDTTVMNRLLNAGLTSQQVQVIWYKEADVVGNTSLSPQVYADSLIAGSKGIMNIIKTKFPHAKICYIASRIYAGYATSTLNPEPYSYWQGWAMKWMIESQINNDPMLQYAGAGANSPWLCWGTYNWANGTTPRSDGLTWDCPVDFSSDGTHPSVAGRQKVATKLLNFLDTDSTACWYRNGNCPVVSSSTPPTAWDSRGPGGGGAIVAASISPFNSNEFYLSCDMSDLFHTTDFGQSYSMTPFTQLQVQSKSEMQFTSNPSKLFILNKAGGGAYTPSKSYDGGAHWISATNPSLNSASQLFASPFDTNQVIVSDRNKIYFSNNESTPMSYATLFNYPGNYGVRIAGVFFQNKDTVYVCSHDSIKFTLNGGLNWQNFSPGVNGIPANEHIISFKGARQGNRWVFYCVTIQANSLPNIYNSTSRDCNQFKGIYRLSQGQTQWVSKTANLQTPAMDKGYLLSMAGNDTSVIYVGGNSTYLGILLGAVFKSVNGGNSFTTVFLTQGMKNSNTNITTGWGGAQASGTSKFKWNGLNYILSMAADPNNSASVVCGDGMWVHTSVDYGANWQQAYTDINHDHLPSVLITDTSNYKTTGLETTASYWLTWTDSSSIIAGYNDIVATRSDDGGHLWNFDIHGLDSSRINDVNMMVIHPLNGTIYAACGEVSGSNGDYTDARAAWSRGRISVSIDNGKNWTTLKSFGHAVTSIAFDPTTTNGMYITVTDVMGGIGDVYHCADVVNNSSVWARLASPPRTENRALQILVLNSGDLVSVYGPRDISATATPSYTYSNSSGIFYSQDGGLSWADRTPLSIQKEVLNVEVDPNDPLQNTWIAFAGNKASAPGVYRTTDRGVNWTNVYNQGVLSGTFHPALPNELYICSEMQGLQYATNTGSNTFSISPLISYPFRRPQKVFFNPYDVNEVWVASFGNGFRVGTTSIVNPCVSTTLDLKLFLEGYYVGSNTMTPVKMNEGVGANPSTVDDIRVELRNPVSSPQPYMNIASDTVTLQTNGHAICSFCNIPSGNYYIVVKHRNSVETWSANPVAFNVPNINYDFTTSANKSFGNNMTEVEPGVWSVYSGDMNGDENIDLLDLSMLQSDVTNFQFGYLVTDLNGDGNVDLLDVPTAENNINNFVFSTHP